MKKVVFIVNVDWYFKLHWIERATFLKDHGYDIHIITNFTSHKIKKYFIDIGFKCHHILIKRKSINPISEIKTILELKKIISIIDPDIIHAITVKPNIYAGINNILLGKNIIYSITGLGAIFSSSLIRFKVIKKIVAFIYRIISTTNSFFIFENESDFQKFKTEKILHGNGTVINGAGVDTEKFYYTTPKCDNNILFASRLLKDKGLDTLLDAVEILKNNGFTCTLNVAGIIDSDVTSSIPLDEILNLDKEGKLNWIGNEENMVSLIHKNDVVCLPTRYGEGVPRILIEAASCGRAIIATDLPGCNDIIKDGYNGLLITPNNAKYLAEQIAVLLEDKQSLIKLGRNGRNRVLKKFDQKIVLKKTLSIYSSFT